MSMSDAQSVSHNDAKSDAIIVNEFDAPSVFQWVPLSVSIA